MAADPYAAAKFFHFIIQKVLETLFSISVGAYRVHSTEGVFGYVSAYFGVVESQARGTLHLHVMLWLQNAPSIDDMESLLKDKAFWECVRAFIRANIRAYLPGLELAESIKRVPNDVEVAYSRPPNPSSNGYEETVVELERRVVRSKNLHTCEMRRCLVLNRKGGLVCKRRAPFSIAEDDFFNEDGTWGPKRLYEFMNTWCPTLSVNVQCNNDIKLLSNSRETMNVTFYITSYQTKKQGRNFNMSAVLTKGFAFHAKCTSYNETLRDQQRLMLFRLVNMINREQELAAPMVMSYLMGWGDTYRSHRYMPIYWSSFEGLLLWAYPSLSMRGPQPQKDTNDFISDRWETKRSLSPFMLMSQGESALQ